MLACGDATQTPDDAAFKACIADWLDVNEWLKQIAAESLMPQLESFMVERNFLLYFVPDANAPHGGRFQLASYDFDTAFLAATCYPSSCDPFTATAGYFGPVGSRPKLATRLTRVFKSDYCAAMTDFLNTVFKPEVVDEMAAVIAPAMVDDPTTIMGDWQYSVDAYRAFIAEHGPAAQRQVDSACR